MKYVINVEEYSDNFFVLKFYPKSLKRSSYKYNYVVNQREIYSILRSCASIIPTTLENNQNASFGFIGSRKVDKKTKLFVEEFDRNKRFRVYSQMIKSIIGDETFTHFEFEKISGYLLINNKCIDVSLKKEEIRNLIHETYHFLEEFE